MARGNLYLRAEHEDWDFIRAVAASPPFDAAIVREKYIAPYPKGHARERQGKDPEELLHALRDADVPWSLDPDSDRFADPKAKRLLAGRAAMSKLARAIDLPWEVSVFENPAYAEQVVEACLGLQLTSQVATAPYIEVEGSDDPRVAINEKFIRLTRERAGGKIVIAYLQSTGYRLSKGELLDPAKRLVGAGADVVFTRIRRFEAEEATTEQVVAYGRLVDAIDGAGARAVPDSVGRLGPTLVAAGADAFVTGPFRFRKVAAARLSNGGGGSGPGLLYEVPGRFSGREPGPIAQTLPSCQVMGCEANDGAGPEFAIRVHNLHEFSRISRLAARLGLDFDSVLAASGGRIAAGWGEALQTLRRERRAA